MEQEKLSREEMVRIYRKDVQRLLPYLTWLEAKAGGQAGSIYENDDMAGHTISVPVYDSQLLQFMKDAQKTGMIDKNYVYVYSRYGLHNEKDELAAIRKATFKEMPLLTGILSKYVILGRTKGKVWRDGVENGVILHAILKMKEIMEFWDKPLA